LAYSTEKALKDYGDKVSAEDRAGIEAKVNDLKNAIRTEYRPYKERNGRAPKFRISSPRKCTSRQQTAAQGRAPRRSTERA
jgi:molecular chaperone DnaK